MIPWQWVILLGKNIEAFGDNTPPLWQPPNPDMRLLALVHSTAERLLSERDLALFKAYYIDGYSGVEAAVMFNLTQARVSQLLSGARREIRGALMASVGSGNRTEASDGYSLRA